MTLALYIHWPYCLSKCPYCDFNSHVGDTSDQRKWRDAYALEMEHYAARLKGRRITSIFFGGGTPSLMEAKTVASVLENAARLWTIDNDAEITLEANPSSVEASKFTDFRSAGVNRLSLGVQSLSEATLKFLGRAHDAQTAKGAISLAHKIFPRFSFDLIYAHREHTLSAWQKELTEALNSAGDHLSLYQLTIEPNTQFDTRARRGEVLTSPDDNASAMYEVTQEMMDKAGLPAYEISNHARKGQESRHNLTYWHYQDYVGIGPGAHGRISQNNHCHATENHRAPEIWLDAVTKNGTGIKQETALDSNTAMREALLMGLRLTEGIDIKTWLDRFAVPLTTLVPPEKVARLIREDYLHSQNGTLRATRSGLQRLNAVLDYMVN